MSVARRRKASTPVCTDGYTRAGPIRSSRSVRDSTSVRAAVGRASSNVTPAALQLVDEILEHRHRGRVEVADRRGVDEDGPRRRHGSATSRSVSLRKNEALAKKSSFEKRKRTSPGWSRTRDGGRCCGSGSPRRRSSRRPPVRAPRSGAGRRAGRGRAAMRSPRPRSRAAPPAGRRRRSRRSRAARHPGRSATAAGTPSRRRARSRPQ